MRKFLPLLVPIIVLLIAVPLFSILNYQTIAKICGVILVVLTVVSIRIWMFQASKARISKSQIQLTVNEIHFLNSLGSFYTRLNKDEKKEFHQKLVCLLSNIDFDQADGEILDKELCLAAGILIISNYNEQIEIPFASKRIIVFWNEEDWKKELQGNSRILFLNKQFVTNSIDELKLQSEPHTTNIHLKTDLSWLLSI